MCHISYAMLYLGVVDACYGLCVLSRGVISEVGGVSPTGKSFVSCVRARAVWMPGETRFTNCVPPISLFPFRFLGGFPFSLVSLSGPKWVQVNPSETM